MSDCNAVTAAHWQDWLTWAAAHGVAVPNDAAFVAARSASGTPANSSPSVLRGILLNLRSC
ncbi:hypothetical protein [Chromatium okenii]|uniref:hypothetical protein n=1 Tax=Chromatium okenii TaxID=61644 RepID=UPI001F5B02E0|nr:hypothetical protein [Chromatium okenii]